LRHTKYNNFKITRLSSLSLGFYRHQPIQYPQSSIKFTSDAEVFGQSGM